MGRKRFTAEQIIHMLCQAEVEIAKGKPAQSLAVSSTFTGLLIAPLGISLSSSLLRSNC